MSRVDPAEVTWTVIVLFGFCVHLYGIKEGFKDLRSIRIQHINHGAELLAKSNIRSEILRTIVKLGFIMIGVIAMFLPPPPPPPPAFKIFNGAVVVVLIGMVALLVTASFLDRRTRRKVMRQAARHEE